MTKIESVLNGVRENLHKDPNVLAATVFGSMVAGEMWDESDLDLFVIVDQDENTFSAACLEVESVDVHLQVLSLAFLRKRVSKVGSGAFHNAFGSGRLLFCKEEEIQHLIETASALTPADRSLRLTASFGKMLGKLYRTRKDVFFLKIDQAFVDAIRLIEEWATIEVIRSGVFAQRDVLIQAKGLDEGLDSAIRLLLSSDLDVPSRIDQVIELASGYVDLNAEVLGRDVIEQLKTLGPLGAEELEDLERYEKLDTDFERIVETLHTLGLIRLSTKPYVLPGSAASIGIQKAYESV